MVLWSVPKGQGTSGAAREGIGQDGTYLFGLHLLLERNHVVASTSEIDALAQSASYETADEYGQKYGHKHERVLIKRS